MLRERGSMKRMLYIIDKISLGFAYLSGALVLIMMISIGYDVVMRHIFNKPTIWADELSCYLLVGISFLGAAYALNTDGHVHIEAVVRKLPPKTSNVLELITDILSVIFLIIFTWQAYRLVINSYVYVRIAPTLMRTPLYIPQLLLAVGLTWFCVQMIAHILKKRFAPETDGDGMEGTETDPSARRLK